MKVKYTISVVRQGVYFIKRDGKYLCSVTNYDLKRDRLNGWRFYDNVSGRVGECVNGLIHRHDELFQSAELFMRGVEYATRRNVRKDEKNG
jgi:hypothetical protein